MPLTIEQILRGTTTGSRQSVGQMEVIPIIGEDDSSFAPPDFHASTRDYGSVRVRNSSDLPSIVPPGAGWVVDQAAQDHAVCGGALMAPKSERELSKACCVQETQGGLIREEQGSMLILPASLRTPALALRMESEYSRLWSMIQSFKQSVGLRGPGNLVDFLKAFAKQLDEFVAEFELVPHQVGGIVLIGGKVVGVERAPSASFWEKLWVPLIRVCYGSLAVQVAQGNPLPPATRTALTVGDKSLDGLQAALREATERDQEVTKALVGETQALQLQESARVDEKMGKFSLRTVASKLLSGQFVGEGDAVRYASLCMSGT
jgi:hypothetical protein